MTPTEIFTAVGTALGAGAPAALIIWRNAARILRQFEAGVTALERIADRLDQAHTVTFARPRIDLAADARTGTGTTS